MDSRNEVLNDISTGEINEINNKKFNFDIDTLRSFNNKTNRTEENSEFKQAFNSLIINEKNKENYLSIDIKENKYSLNSQIKIVQNNNFLHDSNLINFSSIPEIPTLILSYSPKQNSLIKRKSLKQMMGFKNQSNEIESNAANINKINSRDLSSTKFHTHTSQNNPSAILTYKSVSKEAYKSDPESISISNNLNSCSIRQIFLNENNIKHSSRDFNNNINKNNILNFSSDIDHEKNYLHYSNPSSDNNSNKNINFPFKDPLEYFQDYDKKLRDHLTKRLKEKFEDEDKVKEILADMENFSKKEIKRIPIKQKNCNNVSHGYDPKDKIQNFNLLNENCVIINGIQAHKENSLTSNTTEFSNHKINITENYNKDFNIIGQYVKNIKSSINDGEFNSNKNNNISKNININYEKKPINTHTHYASRFLNHTNTESYNCFKTDNENHEKIKPEKNSTKSRKIINTNSLSLDKDKIFESNISNNNSQSILHCTINDPYAKKLLSPGKFSKQNLNGNSLYSKFNINKPKKDHNHMIIKENDSNYSLTNIYHHYSTNVKNGNIPKVDNSKDTCNASKVYANLNNTMQVKNPINLNKFTSNTLPQSLKMNFIYNKKHLQKNNNKSSVYSTNTIESFSLAREKTKNNFQRKIKTRLNIKLPSKIIVNIEKNNKNRLVKTNEDKFRSQHYHVNNKEIKLYSNENKKIIKNINKTSNPCNQKIQEEFFQPNASCNGDLSSRQVDMDMSKNINNIKEIYNNRSNFINNQHENDLILSCYSKLNKLNLKNFENEYLQNIVKNQNKNSRNHKDIFILEEQESNQYDLSSHVPNNMDELNNEIEFTNGNNDLNNPISCIQNNKVDQYCNNNPNLNDSQNPVSIIKDFIDAKALSQEKEIINDYLSSDMNKEESNFIFNNKLFKYINENTKDSKNNLSKIKRAVVDKSLKVNSLPTKYNLNINKNNINKKSFNHLTIKNAVNNIKISKICSNISSSRQNKGNKIIKSHSPKLNNCGKYGNIAEILSQDKLENKRLNRNHLNKIITYSETTKKEKNNSSSLKKYLNELKILKNTNKILFDEQIKSGKECISNLVGIHKVINLECKKNKSLEKSKSKEISNMKTDNINLVISKDLSSKEKIFPCCKEKNNTYYCQKRLINSFNIKDSNREKSKNLKLFTNDQNKYKQTIQAKKSNFNTNHEPRNFYNITSNKEKTINKEQSLNNNINQTENNDPLKTIYQRFKKYKNALKNCNNLNRKFFSTEEDINLQIISNKNQTLNCHNSRVKEINHVKVNSSNINKVSNLSNRDKKHPNTINDLNCIYAPIKDLEKIFEISKEKINHNFDRPKFINQAEKQIKVKVAQTFIKNFVCLKNNNQEDNAKQKNLEIENNKNFDFKNITLTPKKIESDLMHKIINSLDDEYKGLFNFSYDSYINKKNSDSVSEFSHLAEDIKDLGNS